ncbi:MAG: type I DNA topoisomerase [Clostridia bacterium]|nr:type I DNA topoisomerase [Clostridia bacterium]
MAEKCLVIVESPAKAKNINKYLGKNYTVMASMGHVRDLPKSSLGIDIENDFAPKYITIRGKGDLIAKMKKAAKSADKVLLAADPDREGEAISWHLAQILGIDEKSPCRITFNEVTKSAVVASLKDARAIDIDLVNAQQARRELDRIVGYQISPLLWRKVKKGLSAGRVQSSVTKMIVDREKEIEDFVPKEYWSITAILTDESGKHPMEARYWGVNGKKKELGSAEDAKKVLSMIDGAEFVVTKAVYSEKKKHPTPPFTTSTMQQEASRKLGMTSARTMSAAQGLYEGVNVPGHGTRGLITYMRTDSQRIASEALSAVRAFIGEKYGAAYLPEKPNFYRTSKAAQDAHEAIRPTDCNILPEMIKGSVTNDQYKLYKLIWERFVACQMKSALYDAVSADIVANGVTFKASGSAIKFDGYRAVYVEGSDGAEEKDAKRLIHPEEGQKLKAKEINPEQHFTEPPARFTEATLIKTMEENGIGRPSTYTPTISTIISRGYVVREKKMLKPTELGRIVNDIMQENFEDIVDVEFTADMERRLDCVESGEQNWVDLLRDFYNPFEKTLEKAEENIDKVKLAEEVSDEICEKCGRNMVVKMSRYGKFLACPGFPECRNTKPIMKDTGVKCPKCGARIVEKKSKRGKKYFSCEKAPECDFVLWDAPLKTPCPKCGGIMVKKYYKKGSKTVCSNPDCESNRKITKEKENGKA